MKAWLQLMRLPNVFTAVADVMMGYLVTHGSLDPASHFALLAIASGLLYLSGMVLNDVVDAEVDARDRPDRPIPSARIRRRTAAACGLALLAAGTLTAWCITLLTTNWRPGIVATMLAICIVLYDAVLKRTFLAPLAMGGCRFLNVLLGMSLARSIDVLPSDQREYFLWESPATWLIALGVGVYIVGVTWFARTEARTSRRAQLAGGTIVLLVGLALITSVPQWNESDVNPGLVVSVTGWHVLWAAIAVIIARRCILAVYDPTPPRVQAAVRFCVQSIIVIDAAVCVGYVSPLWGLAVLALLAPTLVLAAWLKAT